jgi:myo-inositol-1(or 4)-monophosphatase
VSGPQELNSLIEVLVRIGVDMPLLPAEGADERVFQFLRDELPRIADVPVVGEEVATTRVPGMFWLVDSIDGTYNLRVGDPNFAVCVCLVSGQEALLAGVHRPTSEPVTYSALRGAGAYRNGLRMPLSGNRMDPEAPRLVGFGIGERLERDPSACGRLVEMLARSGYVTRQSGSAALEVCAVAERRRVGYVQPDLRLWDVLAADLIARECGLLTDFGLEGWSGEPCHYVAAGTEDMEALLVGLRGAGFE